MRTRGFTCLLLGMWLAGGILLAFVTMENSRAVDRTMSDPSAAASLRIQKLGGLDSQMLLRYQAAEQFRYYLEAWSNVELALSLLFFFYLLFGTGENKIVLSFGLLLILMVALQRFWIMSELMGLGRLLDFVPDGAPSTYRGRFYVLRDTYFGVEVAKWLVQCGMAVFFIARSKTKSRNARSQLNVVDKPDYGHVNR